MSKTFNILTRYTYNKLGHVRAETTRQKEWFVIQFRVYANLLPYVQNFIPSHIHKLNRHQKIALWSWTTSSLARLNLYTNKNPFPMSMPPPHAPTRIVCYCYYTFIGWCCAATKCAVFSHILITLPYQHPVNYLKNI